MPSQGEKQLQEARLRGRVAIVTGGARGLGRAVAERLAREGAAVCIMSLREESAQAAAQEIASKFGTTIAVRGDVAVEEDMRSCVQRTVSAFGRLDIMVNNAGTIAVDSVTDTSVEQWDRVIATNLRGTFLGCREAARQMIRQGDGGRILNCSSGAGRRGNGLIASYAASKFGIIGLTQSLAVELAKHRITVNAYCPGHVTSTPMWDYLAQRFSELNGVTPADVKNGVAHEAPLDRVGTPEEIAGLVAYLASDEASFVTGESVLIDGGLTRF
ncbi:MAG TPA: glucose 1-dehydrogenase [Candidatus Dormibacteraeota bacterium]|nr:glucose 1-dehydrogenase [Candidatus Dormibacteraeota bacterium]